jgi:hypothetical protein
MGERSSVVELHVANVKAVGSNPIARSIFFCPDAAVEASGLAFARNSHEQKQRVL